MENGEMAFGFDVRDSAVDELHAATGIYTSTEVVEGLLDRIAWPKAYATLLDPSCGDGSFLVSALGRMPLKVDDADDALRVRGWEIHPGAAAEARNRVEAHLLGRGWTPARARRTAVEMVVEADFLINGPAGQFSVICANPPYLRFAHLPEYFKQMYSSVLAGYAMGDIMHAFIDRCCGMIPDDGVVAMISADRWLFNETASKLREEIGRRVGLDHVARLDPTTSFYQAKTRRCGTPPRIHPVEVVLRRAGKAKFPITAAPISPDGVEVIPIGMTLGDVADVRCGPWMAKEGIFVVSEEVAATLGEVKLIPAIDTDDIDPHTDVVRAPRRYAIVTDKEEEPTGALQAHLLSKRHLMPKSRKGKAPYWVPPERATMDLSKPSLLIPRIARKLRAIPLPAGVLPVNHNLSVVAAKEGTSLEQLRTVLTSEASQGWLARNAPRIDNGYFSIITTLLRRLPVECGE